MFRVSRPKVSRSVNKYKAHHKEFVRGVLHKRTTKPEPSMMQGNTWSKCKEKSTAFKRKGTGGVLDIWLHHRGILRQCPQESPLANGQVLIDGQVLIRLMAGSMTNRRVQVVDGDIKISQATREKSQGVSWIRWYEAQFIQLTVGSKSSSGGSVIVEQFDQMRYGALVISRFAVGSKGFSEISRFYYNMRVSPGLCRKSVQQELKDFDSRLITHEWNQKAKEEINLQKDVQVSVQALEQVRDFDSKLGSQLKTLDEGDENSEWQWDCHIPFIRRFKKIMKGLQDLLKMELRKVRRGKRRQGDAEDELVCSKHQEGSTQRNGYGLGPNRWSFVRFGQSPSDMFNVGPELEHPGSASMASLREIEESNDLVNYIGCVFRYFIVDVVDPESTPNVAHCGRELGFKKIMKGLQALLKVEKRKVKRDKRRQGDAEDELVCSKHQEGSAQRNGYGLGPNRPLGQVLIQRRRDHDRDLQAKLSVAKAKSLGGRSLKHLGSASMASLREIELIDSWSPRLEEERHMKKFPSETKETRKVKEIFGLQEKKKNCWTFFAAAAQVYGERIHESVESVEMISSYEIRVSLEFSRGARICYYVRRTSGYSQDKMVAGC
ncbi:hypothetical protein F2Q69_00024679 [Brassica cretica]|uniref:Uncharacterized protein n=1 Tax=Brassica cretica TaxID=69181 RepID=A0A8S9QTL1_BRACR|nr:hypothetical protein F2Q69_00024679 [Brassica cretica]